MFSSNSIIYITPGETLLGKSQKRVQELKYLSKNDKTAKSSLHGFYCSFQDNIGYEFPLEAAKKICHSSCSRIVNLAFSSAASSSNTKI